MNLYEVLEKLDIKYKIKEHKAVKTCEEASKISNMVDGIGTKNLFLTDKKGKYFLICMDENKKANIKEIATLVGTKKLSFASLDDLKNILNLEEGGVTPLGIINDSFKLTRVILDKSLEDKLILVNPNIPTATISIKFSDLIKFIEYLEFDYILY